MPIRIEVRPSYIHVSWHGLVTSADLNTLFKELPITARTCGIRPNVLHTADRTAEMQLGTWDACEYALRRSRTSIPVPVRAAFVGDSPMGAALARTFRSFNNNPSLTMEVFPTEAEAVAWLLAAAVPDGGRSNGTPAMPPEPEARGS